jgi:hypothetical protein
LRRDDASASRRAPAKRRYAIRRTKFVLNTAADGHLAQAVASEVPVDSGAGAEDRVGFEGFAQKSASWKELRARSMHFWQDR